VSRLQGSGRRTRLGAGMPLFTEHDGRSEAVDRDAGAEAPETRTRDREQVNRRDRGEAFTPKEREERHEVETRQRR
jgi:hypothetical protein